MERIRYMTSHPLSMSPDLIAAHRDCAQLMPFLHLPVQSGSDAVLKAMNRKHTADDYRRIVADLRAARPDVALSSDFIVGFPGESEQNFNETMQFVEDIGFSSSYSFAFSARPGTPAAAMPKPVPDDARAERLARLQALLSAQQRDFNAGFVGRAMPVLFERAGKRPGQILGRSPWGQPVHADGPESLLGRTAQTLIARALGNSLAGALAP